MGWAVGRDINRQRHIGYGVPAICDHPGCGEEIDRGMGYACGGGQTRTDECCGLFFCSNHMWYLNEVINDVSDAVCERCAENLTNNPDGDEWVEFFEPTPDTLEWATHVVTDESWEQFRAEEPEWTKRYKEIVDDSTLNQLAT